MFKRWLISCPNAASRGLGLSSNKTLALLSATTARKALIRGNAVLQDYLLIGPHSPMRTPHEQAATHGGRFRPRYESQAAAQHLPRHRAQNRRRGSVEQQDACATTTASNSLTFISKMSRGAHSPAGDCLRGAVARRPPRDRAPSCRSCGVD